MTNTACVRGVLGKKAEGYSDAELSRIIEDLRARKGMAAKAAGGTQTAQAIAAIAKRKADRLRMEAAIQKRNAAENAVKRRTLLDQQANYRTMSEWAEAMAVPSNRDVPGARDSAQAKQDGYIGKYSGGFVAAMEKDGLLPYVTTRLRDLVDPNKWGKGALDDKIAIELWALTAEGGEPGKTKSPEAATIAKHIHKFQELARADLNRLGAFIGKIPGYIVAQTHDMGRIVKTPFEEWRKVAERAFGNERTYENLALTGDAKADAKRLDEFWGNIYYALSTGEHFKAGEPSGFRGPQNVAKKVSQHRVLHPNSAEDWIAYNDQFGSSSLMEAVFSGFTRAGKAAGLMEKFGTNPRAMWEGMIADAEEFAKRNRQPLDPRLKQGGFSSRLFDVLDGTADIPASITVAKLGALARAHQTTSKLGGAVLSSIIDPIISAARIRDTYGDNLLSAFFENVSKRLQQLGDQGKQREAALLLHVGFDAITRDITSRVTAADSVNFKWVNKATNAYFKLNLLSKYTDSGEFGMAAMHAARLGMRKERAFAELEPELQAELGHYAITEKEWDIIREHAVYDHDGTPLLVADKLRDMPPEKIDPLVKGDLAGLDERQLTRRRELAVQELESKWNAFNIGQVHGGVIRGTTREKAYATQGLQAGTPAGEAIRMMMQFKQYPLAFVQQVLGRMAQEDRFWSIPGALARRVVTDRSVAAKFASLFTSILVLGYTAGALKDIAKGRTPRDPLNPNTWGAALVQGGGAGIYGDFLFARVNRFGGSLTETAIGPGFGAVGEAGDILLGSRDALLSDIFGDGETEYPDNKAFQFFKNNTPFVNLFYTRAALDYLILYDIQEKLSPGSLRRLEQKLKKEQGQEFILPPSQNRVRY
jgi:hypothetical protein